MKIFAGLILAATFTATAAIAGEIVDEVRIGASGLLDSSSSSETGAVGSAEVYFAPFGKPSDAQIALLKPRIQIGVSAGRDAVDQIYTGLNWHIPITESFFAEFGAGGTVHNGNLDSGPGPRLGCRLLFREHAALGLAVTDAVNVLATIDHSSNASLCDGPNDGLTHAGVAVGVKF